VERAVLECENARDTSESAGVSVDQTDVNLR
jgi:hypothetical protein